MAVVGNILDAERIEKCDDLLGTKDSLVLRWISELP